jgi:TP901-1 family phage major tail protein
MGTNIHGKDAELAISSDGGSTYNTVAGVVDITINFSDELADVSDKDSSGHKEYIPGFDDVTVDVSLRWEEDDTYFADLEAAAIDKLVRNWQIRPQTDVGSIEYTGAGYISSFSVEMPNDDAVQASATIQITGGLTSSAQTT